MSNQQGSKGFQSHDIAEIAKRGLDDLLWVAGDLSKRIQGEAHPTVYSGLVNSFKGIWGEIFKVCGIGTTIYFQEGKESALEQLSRILSEAEKDEK